MSETFELFKEAVMDTLDEVGEKIAVNTIDNVITDPGLRDLARQEFKRSWKSAFLLYDIYELKEWWDKETEIYTQTGEPVPAEIRAKLAAKAIVILVPWWQVKVIQLAWDITDYFLKKYDIKFNPVYAQNDFGTTYGSDGSRYELTDYTAPSIMQSVIPMITSDAVAARASSGDETYNISKAQTADGSGAEGDVVNTNAAATPVAGSVSSPWNDYVQKYGGITGFDTSAARPSATSGGSPGGSPPKVPQKNNLFSSITDASKQAWQQVQKDAEQHLQNVLKGTESFSHAFTTVWSEMAQKTKQVLLDKLVKAVEDVLQKQVLKPLEDFGEHLLNSIIPGLFPGKASGGPVAANTPYIVGEVGPELFIPGSTGTIVPNNKLAVGAVGGSGDVTVNLINNSGQPIAQPQVQKRSDGKRMVVDIFLEAYRDNTGGLRAALQGGRS